MTGLRRCVPELLWDRGVPTSAYQLIEAVKCRDVRPVGLPTAYPAHHFLMAQDLVAWIESLNADAPKVHPERDHDCPFFVRSGCRHRSSLGIRRWEDCLLRVPPSLGLSRHVARLELRACVGGARKPARLRREPGTAPMASQRPDGPSWRLDVSAATRQELLA